MRQPRPIDRNRAGRLIIALLDQDKPKAEAAIGESLKEGTLPELFDTITGDLLTALRLTIGEDNIRQLASDWILHSHTMMGGDPAVPPSTGSAALNLPGTWRQGPP